MQKDVHGRVWRVRYENGIPVEATPLHPNLAGRSRWVRDILETPEEEDGADDPDRGDKH